MRLVPLFILSLLLVAALPSVAAAEILGVDDGKAARTTNGTSLAVGLANAPAASGNTVVLTLNGSGGSTVAITPPAGFVERDCQTVVNISKVCTYTKLAGASEPTSYTVNFSTSAEHSGTIREFSGVDSTTPVGDVQSIERGDVRDHECPVITAGAAGEVYHCGLGDTNGSTWTVVEPGSRSSTRAPARLAPIARWLTPTPERSRLPVLTRVRPSARPTRSRAWATAPA